MPQLEKGNSYKLSDSVIRNLIGHPRTLMSWQIRMDTTQLTQEVTMSMYSYETIPVTGDLILSSCLIYHNHHAIL